jgi:hypothetical protein
MRAVRLSAVVLAGALALAACGGSSEEEAAESPSATSSASASGLPDTSAGRACAAYFDLDLLNSTYAGGAVSDGDMTEAQARQQFTKLLRTMVRVGAEAEQEGTLSEKFVGSATKMLASVKALPNGAALSAMPAARQKAFAAQSTRAQKACERAGFPLPDDNVIARTAAGV